MMTRAQAEFTYDTAGMSGELPRLLPYIDFKPGDLVRWGGSAVLRYVSKGHSGLSTVETLDRGPNNLTMRAWTGELRRIYGCCRPDGGGS